VAKLTVAAPRQEVIAANLETNSYVALVDGPEEAIAVANAIAPEHLELMTADPEALLPLVRHAGAVFCGAYAPASVGDYVAGPSHVLPTYGSARFAGALRVDDFIKHMHVVSMDEPTLARLAPHVAAMAEAEGLPTHAESVRIRGPR
jgi:histidinol dehydrogenase